METAKTTVEKATPRFHYGYVVLTMIVTAVFGSLGLGRFGYTSILPAMQDGLKLTNTQTGELQSWNLVGYLLTVVFAGLIAARWGPRVVIAVALLVAGLAMLATGLFPFFDAARLGRFFTGVGNAGANVPAMALVSAWFGAKRRGVAAGIAVAGSSVGLMVTGPLVPSILNQFGAEGWRVSWYVLGSMTLSVGVLCWMLIRNRPDELGLTPVGDVPMTGGVRPSEKKASSLDWGLIYKSRKLWHLAAIYFAFGFAYIIYSTFFVRYLVKEAGFSAGDAGALWLQIGIVTTISGFIWGSISDRWGRRIALIGVFALQGISFLVFGMSHELPSIYFSAVLFALTAWSVPALMAAFAGDLFGARLAPAALGLLTIVFGTGQAIGPYLAGAIADNTQSFAFAFVTAGVVSLLGAVGSMMLRTVRS
ncbi:MAG: MFS transporter [Chloroflexi bacterium]|nr:MFS transporter [Chloroflexota bacterium]